MAARIGSADPYVCGDRLSVADVLLMTCLDWAVLCDLVLPEPVAHYRRRVALRPAYRAALTKNFAK
jgi:glutathione S-transferase